LAMNALLVVSSIAFAPPACTRQRVPCAIRAVRTSMLAMGPISVDESWTTTTSGLQYLDSTIGDGGAPSEGACVRVAYTGWLEDSGKEFDSSIGRQPIAFNVGQRKVIEGWDEGIMSMRVGGKRRLSIPSELAYGEDGAGDAIPPNSRLQFECELVGIETGIGAFTATFPGGLPNFVLTTVLLLSFIPYFVPPDVANSIPFLKFWLVSGSGDGGAFPLD